MMTLQVTNRKQWHGSVERSLAAAIRERKPFTVESLLNAAGVFMWSPYRTKARLYVEALLAARNDPPESR